MKQKDIKELVKTGNAIDITSTDISNLWQNLEKISVSFGVYGINGGLFRHVKTGKLYAITKRTSNLFVLV